MPVSGRRHRALVDDNTKLLTDNHALIREVKELTEQLEAVRSLVRGLSERNRELLARPLARGEAVLARQLRLSEEARALLAEQIDILQTANEGAAREAYDLARAARAVAA